MSTLTVHLRVTDAATGKPTPCRLRVTGPEGTYHPPAGHPSEIPTGPGETVGGGLRFGPDRFAYIDGATEIRLPTRTPLGIEITKGPEYAPVRETVTLGPGQIALRFALGRRFNLRERGWYSGDSRCHFLSPHDALLEAEAEDLAVVNLLAGVRNVPSMDGSVYPATPNLLAFSGQSPALERAGHLVAVNTHNAHPVLGRLGLLHCHRPVFPLTFGGDDPDDWSLEDWCDQCHRKKGLVVWTDAFGSEGLPGGEALVNLIRGRIDALEVDGSPRGRPIFPAWYRLLNAGLNVPLVGGSGKDSNRVALGGVRTYARCDTFGYANWVEAVRAGRTFVTSGPLLEFAVENGRATGSVEGAGDGTLELIANGRPVADSPSHIDTPVSLPEGGWLALRFTGRGKSPWQPTVPEFAHTSAVFVGPPRRDPDAVAALRAMVGRTRDWVERSGRFEEERFRGLLLAGCDEALARLADG